MQDTSKPAETTPVEWKRTGLVLAALLLATLGVYLQIARHDFVNYDDPDYVTSNAQVQAGLSWRGIGWAFTSGHASNWHPLTWISHMLDVEFFGVKPGPHHLVNLLFHLLNTGLLFVWLRQVTGTFWRCAFVAGLFALHPLHVESVAWVSERKDVLSTFFFLLTIIAYSRYVLGNMRGADRPDGGTRWFYGLALLFFALGLMSKPMLVTVPFLLLLLDYWPLRRRVRVLDKLPFLALTLLSSAVTYLVQREGGAVSKSLSLWARVENAWVSYVRYMGKMLWPDNLSVLYPHPGAWPAWQVIGSVVLLVAITACVVSQWRKRPFLPVGWFWFVGTMVPVIGLVQVGIQSMADRYTYIPLTGLFICIAWGVSERVRPGTDPQKYVGALATAVLLLCAISTWKQVQYWRNSEALFARAVAVTKQNYLAYNNLGFHLSNQGRTSEALTNYLRSLEINPNYEDALNNIGFLLAGQRRHAEAVGFYERALRVRPEHVEVHNNLGNALSELGRIEEAITHYRFVLERKPTHADAHNNLGIALAMKGLFTEAIGHFEKAIQYKKGYAGAHSNLGNAYAVQRKLSEAIEQYEISLRLSPKDPQAHNNLGNALVELGRFDEAIAHYREALRLNRDNPEAHFNLGYVLQRKGDREGAKRNYLEALRLRPDYGQAAKQLESLK